MLQEKDNQIKDNQITELVDQKGEKHVGQVWQLTDCEGQDYTRFREAVTGKLFPLNIKKPSKK